MEGGNVPVRPSESRAKLVTCVWLTHLTPRHLQKVLELLLHEAKAPYGSDSCELIRIRVSWSLVVDASQPCLEDESMVKERSIREKEKMFISLCL